MVIEKGTIGRGQKPGDKWFPRRGGLPALFPIRNGEKGETTIIEVTVRQAGRGSDQVFSPERDL